MRRAILVVVLLYVIPVLAQAQDQYPKAEIFGGFSVVSAGDVDPDREQFFGWQASVAGNVHRNVGLVADFGQQFKTIEGFQVRPFQFLFGPRVSIRTERVSGFVHALFGGLHVGIEGQESENGFAMGIGGGVDVNATNRVAIRLIQFDWVPNRLDDEWSKDDVRFGFGIVIKVGGGS